mgnify:CR=1 FL=1
MNKPAGFNTTQIKQLTDIVSEVVDIKLDNKLKPIVKRLDKIQNDLNTTINFFDRITIDHEVRIKQIENRIMGVL